MHAAKRLVVFEKLLGTTCLNFASAKNPGGGFLNGSQAQEESLVRSSGLYPCIRQFEEMYEYNRNSRTGLYSDYMAYSPDVPVIRDDSGMTLDQPYKVSFITAAAVNAGVVEEKEPHNVSRIQSVMKERIRRILLVSSQQGNQNVILGAWGCGVFRNRPEDVADSFRQVLLEEGYAGLFQRIVFAISKDQKVFGTFERVLGRRRIY